MDRSERRVFVVRGRDATAFDAVCEILKLLDVEPVTWSQAIEELGKNNAVFGDILNKGFEMSAAALVLLTPDEHAVLRSELRKEGDAGDRNKTGPIGQPRPNVYYELGYSMRHLKEKTIVISFTGCRMPSDMYGLDSVEFDASAVAATAKAIAKALGRAGVPTARLPSPDEIERSCPRACSLKARPTELPDYIRAGTSVHTTEFAYDQVLDGKCERILMIGTNFGDQFGSRDQPKDDLFARIKRQLLDRDGSTVTLVFAPPDLLRKQSEEGFDHLRKFSLPRMCDLYDAPDLGSKHRARLRILAHPGAMYFQAFVRDPHDDKRALLVATPRWPKDAAGVGRFFFAIRRSEHARMFDALYAQIPSDLELGGAIPFDVVARQLRIPRQRQPTSARSGARDTSRRPKSRHHETT